MSTNNFIKFGQILIHPGYLLLAKGTVFAFLAPIPIIPGHILLCPKQEKSRLMDLDPETLKEFSVTLKILTGFVQDMNNTSSATVNIQEGEQAGQKIMHLHAHIIPRHYGDFENNDDLYPVIDAYDDKLIQLSQDGPYVEESVIKLAQIYRTELQKILPDEDELKKYGLI